MPHKHNASGSRARANALWRYLAVQHAVSRILAKAPALPEASRQLLEAICDSLNWEVGVVWECDTAAGVLRCVEVWCAPHIEATEFVAATQARTFALGVGLPGRIWASRAPAWVPDVVHDENFPRAPFAAKVGLHGAFGFPIALGGEILGTFEFFSPQIREPDEGLLQLMGSIGSQIGQFIDRQRAHQIWRDSEARKIAVFECSLDGIITIDHRGHITEFNPAAERIFGYTRAEVLGREMASLIVPPHLRDRHRRGLERYVTTGEASVLDMRIEMCALRADGTVFPVELSITRIPIDGPPMFTGYLRDITARKEAEQERDDLLRREKAARAEAETASRLKEEFLATLSHELRTPLTAILGWARMLCARTLDPETADRALGIIERNAALQARLVADLLDMSQILSGRFRLDIRNTELIAVIEAAVDAIRPVAESKGIRLIAALAPDVRPMLADPDRLEQIVWNLLSNAIKFTPPGGRVEVRTEQRDQEVEISVSDTGQGIDPTFLPFMFDHFRQADASTTRVQQGLGLGLAIVRDLTELHGGTVRAFSEGPGKGAVLKVRLPSVAAEVGRPAKLTQRDAPDVRPPINRRSALADVRILVVDDDPDARQVIVATLEAYGARVTAAASAAEALAGLEIASPDVLLADIEMPEQDGYALIRSVRAFEALRGTRTPAAALTAYARAEDRARALAAGYDQHIAKPFEPADLVEVVASLAGRADGSR